ncbi:MAG: hypothetical protein ABFD98_00375 [Syntrophobacteraceae bacterium]
MHVTIEDLKYFTDGRGSVVEPLEPERIVLQRNVHVVLTEPGCVRGNHYHERGVETLVVYGPALVRTRETPGEALETQVPGGAVFRFHIPPGVSHAVMNTGTGANLLLAFNTVPHDPAAPDTFMDVLF